MPAEGGRSRAISDTIRSILSSRGLTLAEVERRSGQVFRDDRRFHIPPNLYHVLEAKRFSPSIHQIFALSRVSNYRMADWLAVFGLPLTDIPRLQAVLPARLTTLIDGSLFEELEPLFEQINPGEFPSSLRPLSEWVRLGQPQRRFDREASAQSSLYAKIGSHDAFAFPDLLPGSILRVAKLSRLPLHGIPTGRSGAFFLIEHANGLTCSRLHVVARNRVVLCPAYLPFAQVELELGKQARVLGAADFELRPTRCSLTARVPPNLYRFWTPQPLQEAATGLPLERLLARARRRAGLTFREASAKSALVARALGHKDYFCAVGALSDYESQAGAPRHAQKMFSLCALYSLNPWEFMAAAGLRLSEAGKDAMPQELQERVTPEPSRYDGRPFSSSENPARAEFPYLFGRAAAELFRMNHLSIRDLFSIGKSDRHFHPYLADAALLVVDRRKKQIITLPQAPLSAQPLYVLVRRNGQFVCTSCVAEDKGLVLRPFSNGVDRPLRLEIPTEIEIVGRVVGILRKVLPNGVPHS